MEERKLCDPAAERAAIAGVFRFGQEAYLDLNGVVTPNSFAIDTNQVVYRCLEHLFKDRPDATPDVPSILSAANTLGLAKLLESPEERKHLRAVISMPVERSSILPLAKKVRKLEVARELKLQIREADGRLDLITGDEPVDQILACAEEPIFDFTSLLASTDGGGPANFGDGVDEYVQHLVDNPRPVAGISTGFRHYDNAIGDGLEAGTISVIAARPKQGKAQPLDSLVQTPTGPKRMGDIAVGDAVCSPDGGFSLVESVHPQGLKRIYRVVFDDGDSVECCEDHLWEVSRRRGGVRVLALRDIVSCGLREPDGRNRWAVRLPSFCYRTPSELPIDPYTLGVLLGDGSTRSNGLTLTSVDEELLAAVTSELQDGYELRRIGSGITYRVTKGRTGIADHSYMNSLRRLGLWRVGSRGKFIPDVYKYSGRAARLAVLQGLMDTDGTADVAGNCEFSSSSLRLANDFKELVQSLGGLCSIKPRITRCEGRPFRSYRCRVRFNDNRLLFRLSRKKRRCSPRAKNPLRRTIARVEYVGEKEAQCIKLSSVDGLYLTDHHVVTHNTMVVNKVGLHVAAAGIPVLNCDTELHKRLHWNRLLAAISGVPTKEIKRGSFSGDRDKLSRVRQAAAHLKSIPYDYVAVAGQPFEEQLAMMRRWVMKKVGLGPDGKAKPCVIIYDWLKLPGTENLSKNMQEFQALGFMLTGMMNFMRRFGVSCLAFAQLNRDGIDGDDTSAVAQSDRIVWFCSNLSYLKRKSPEEIAEESSPEGRKYTHKLVPRAAREGGGLDEGDYINLRAEFEMGRITEGPTRNELHQQNPSEGFDTHGIATESVPF